LITVTAVAAPFYTALSSSSHVFSAKRVSVSGSAATRSFLPSFSPEGVFTYAPDCTTPKTDFNLGDGVCAKASGVPATVAPFSWHVFWGDPEGLIRQSDTAIDDDTTTYSFTLPATTTSNVDGKTIDNRGTWTVNLARANGVVRQVARFTVHDNAQPVADVYVKKFERSGTNQVGQGGNIAFIIQVGNNGPDGAVNVNLVDSTPAGMTLLSFSQQSGPACAPAATANCTMATLSNGEVAEFTGIYDTGSNGQGSYSASASVSNDTPDPDLSNNTSSADFAIVNNTTSTGCDLTCPTNITADADTIEGGQPGTHVTYPGTVADGTCGSVTANPASGSFFPVGTTVVTVTSETGNGVCQFAVIVTQPTGNVTISCPQNLTSNADGNCGASFSLGNPTTTGDNVTVSVSRSDGKPMYDCDINGQNCVRKTTDLPFNVGITVVTWTAFSHDTPGPYANDADEEAHRTGNKSCNQTVTVNDVTPPTVNASNVIVSADANCQAAVPDFGTLAIVSDNCACASSDTSEICDTRQDIKVTQDVAPGTLLGLGPHSIQLTANDGSSNNNGAGNTTTVTITLTVADTTAPVFTFVPPSVTAYTGPGATTCDAVVSDATLGTATATDNCGPVTITRTPTGNTFGVGTTTVTWKATDGAGNFSTATQTVTVIDNTAPTITLNGQTPSMWPPNHKYQTFSVTNFVTSVFDNCGGVTVNSVVIDHVTSDETENGNGDGNTTNDIIIASNCKSVQLRSERDGGGNGRVYTITFRLTDTHGNVTTADARVVVAHNPGETPVDSGPHYTVNGTCP
jgi:uncharacterized repeat protein (TIGR01451 family)